MEYVGHNPNTVLGTIHCPTNYGGNGDGGAIEVATAETEFHEYSVEWTPDSIMFMADDVVYHTYYNKNEGVDQWPYDKPFYLIFNVSIGGNLGGEVDENLFDNPVTLEIDYVRVYQQPQFSAISGKTEIAKSEANINYTSSVPANNYIWEVPTGATINEGQGTSDIKVNWGCESDTIGLILETDCDTVSLSLPVNVVKTELSGKLFVKIHTLIAQGYKDNSQFIHKLGKTYSEHDIVEALSQVEWHVL